MYTPSMHDEIKSLCNKHYGSQLLHEDGFSLGRSFTFASVLELIEQIEDLQSELEKKSNKSNLLLGE